LSGAKTKANVDQSLRWLIGIVLACLALVLGLKIVFADLQNELNARSVNERARLFVGEEIVHGIQGVEKDIYLMSVATNPAGYGRAYKSLNAQLDKLMHDLNVLKFGGTARREVQLNLEGRDAMVREATYQPDQQKQGHVMELIEIGPLLGQTRDHADELERLLALRWQAMEKEDRTAFFQVEERIATYLKFIPPQFERLDENANRLFFDSSERLRGIELELQTQRDRLRQVEMSLVALVLVLSGLATALFVRRINQSNHKLEDALEAMRAARDEAERASRAKSEFVSRMSHELRTPLNAIIGFAELLEDEALAPEQHSYVKLINGSGKHLMELINQVLDHSKIEAGGLKLERIAFDFSAEIEAVMSIVTERATAKGLDFVASIADDLPRYVEGDPTRLRQILINLLANAVKFTERGSVELRVAREDGRIHFSVRDTGIGMDQAALARLFKPFSQADDSVTRKFGGTGLGLMIARDLIDTMGGDLEVESAPQVGSCFWFWIPLKAATTAGPTNVAPGGDNTGSVLPTLAEIIPGRVLLVDDNRVNQQLAAAMLERLGLAFELADNGGDCLRHLAEADYALVLMDMEMPGMDGVTATRQIRASEAEGCHLPIVAMTANALQEDRERCFAAGMDGYIPKPISLESLRNELYRLFGQAAPQAKPPEVYMATSENSPAGNRAAAIALMGDEEIFREVATMFVADAPKMLDELNQALAASDWPALTRIAHTLKGLLATFAAKAGEAVARQLEAGARANNAGGDCAHLTDEVRRQTERLIKELSAEA
jgi:signal transduction histidine kinase/DNA-binding response OmpR family regulator